MPQTSPASKPTAAQPAGQLNNQLTVLVVDPNPGIRTNLQNMLNQSGISKIEYAVSSGTAIKQLGRKSFDVILCEYDLGGGTAGSEGQDGQQLLEDLRHHKLIPPWAIFIMLTSEAAYERVIGAAELQPTEYILKPFTSGMLAERIGRALARRAALLPAYQQVAQGNAVAAIATAADTARAHPRYAADCARLQAELYASIREYGRAESLYREVLSARPMGWARLGLARMLFAQHLLDEARALLVAIVADSPRLMAAYDLLARCQEAQGEAAAAQKTLEQAVAISPHMVRRLRKLGEVALEAGDHDAAEKSFRQVVSRSRYSEFRNPEDHVNLVRALVKKGDAPAAEDVIRDLERSLRGTPAVDACKAMSTALLHEAGGNRAGAVAELKSAVGAVRGGGAVSSSMRIGLARSCLTHRLDEEASEVMLGATSGPDAVSVAAAADVFVQAGRPDLADGMHQQLRAQAMVLLGVADEKRNMGDVRGAVQTLLEALALAPRNLQVMVAVAGGILRQVMEMGWDHPLAAVCEEQLAEIRTLDPQHPRLAALESEFAAARRKYGMAT
jgi:CheY-like chemotaxis protein/Tfp pilus assembly protein PilF